jgi:phosphoglycolate phosphatase
LQLLIFDLDGTLIDSRVDLAESANELLASYGAAPLDVGTIIGMVGDGARMLVTRALRAARLRSAAPAGDEALARFLDIYDRHLVDHTRMYPGIAEMLAAIAPRATLALLTNKPTHHTHRLIDALAMAPYFGGRVVGGDGAAPRKPDPAGLLGLVAAAHADTARTIMVGDSNVDVQTGRRAGVRVCVAGYGFGFAQVPADELAVEGTLLAREPSDLLPCLEPFLAGPTC